MAFELVVIASALLAAAAGDVPGRPDARSEPLPSKAERLKEHLPADPRTRDAAEAVKQGRASPEQRTQLETALSDAERSAASAPAVVVSGAISMGSYQAGFVSALVRYWSVSRAAGDPDPMPRVWSGASAGAVNALLGGIASCDERLAADAWSPESSLFWKLWVEELDLEQLLPRDDARRTDHLFSATHLGAAMARIAAQAAAATYRPGCSFGFGVTTTNLQGRDIEVGSGSVARLKRVTEKTAVQVRVDAEGRLTARLPFLDTGPAPADRHFTVRASELPYYVALGATPEGSGGQEVAIETVLETPRASGAFPVAFPPFALELSTFERDAWKPKAPVPLMDGGFLNNNPLDIAERIGRRWVDTGFEGFDPQRFPVVYIDQDVVDWEWRQPRLPQRRSPLSETYFDHVPTLVAAARDSVVLETLENHPDLSGRVKIPRRSSVLPSEFRYSMLGFADRAFRAHDFYRGIGDAVRFLSTQLRETRPVEARDAAAIRERMRIRSRGLDCVESPPACGDAEEGLARLRAAADALTAAAHRRELRSDDVDALLAELARAGYRYSPGLLNGARSTGTRDDFGALRARAGRAFHDLLSHQRGGGRVLLRPAGSAFLDEWLTYTPPRHAWTLNLSRSRGVGVGLELTGLAGEARGEAAEYSRSEWRLGLEVDAFGRNDRDRVDLEETRLRWVTLGLYTDRVSDLDGFSGAWSALDLGPYVRWRAGVGASASWLTAPEEWVLSPDLRVGIDVLEMVGVRVWWPVVRASFRSGEEGALTWGRLEDLGVGVAGLVTRW